MTTRLIFSIIIPTRNRHEQLRNCLHAISRMDFPESMFEVVVVDDGSRIPPHSMIQRFAPPLNIQMIVQPGTGPAAARNRGVKHARGRFLVFTDDDCSPASHWLTRIYRRMEASPNCLLGGQTINALPANPFSSASQMLVNYLYAYYNTTPEDALFLTSCNLAVAAEPFRDLEGFDSRYPKAAAEDRDLCRRWHRSGNRLVYAPEVVVYHRHALRLSTFLHQHFGYGQGAYRFHSNGPGKCNGRIEVEPIAFYAGLLCYPFQKADGFSSAVLASLMALSQVANAAGFFSERWRRECR